MKTAGPPRIISDTEAPLREPMRVTPAVGTGVAPVELAITRAITEPVTAPAFPLRCRFVR